MKLSDLLRDIPVLEMTAGLDLEISGVSYDSRKTEAGHLFVAISGYAMDGHKFIPMAAQKGAACVLCERKPEAEIPYILVEDSRAALAALGANWYGRPAEKMTVIGVTGTNGKTTSTYLLKSVLEQCLGAKVGLIGTIQNMIGDEILETERTTPPRIATELGAYLYEPNAAVMKAGIFNALSQQFQIAKLAKNTNLFTANELHEDFPGRIFRIEAVHEFHPRKTGKELSHLANASIAVRNFPMTTEELRKVLKIKDGNACYLFVCTLWNDKRVILHTNKIKGE